MLSGVSATSAQAQSPKVAFSAGGAFPDSPESVFLDDYNTGFDLSLRVEFPLSSVVGVGAHVEYDRFRFAARDVLSATIGDQIGEEVRLQGGGFEVLSGGISARIYAPTGTWVRPYVSAGGGLYRMSTSNVLGQPVDPDTEEGSFNVQGVDATRFGVRPGAGIEFDLVPEIDLIAEAQYVIIFGENILVRNALFEFEDLVDGESDTRYIPLRLGLAFSL